MTLSQRITEALMAKSPRPKSLNPRDLLHTGSTLLNLALSGHARGGWCAGRYHFFVGDSSSGKTFLALSCLAEACYNKRFNDYKLIYDNSEDGALMDVTKFFGPRLAERLEAPAYTADGDEVHSEDIEDFYFNLDTRLEEGPCIYILDSMDSLSSQAEKSKFKERKTAKAKSEAALAKVAGDYGDGKAKKNSAYLRQVRPKLAANGSILIIISQTRDNIEKFALEKKTRAGGHALRFYAAAEVWTKRIKKLEVKHGALNLQTGIISRIQVKKNRLSGKEWNIEVPIYHTYGIDDVGSCVDYLVSTKYWHKPEKGSVITAADFDMKGTREKLVSKIIEADKVKQLRILVGDVWKQVEEAVALKRPPRYV